MGFSLVAFYDHFVRRAYLSAGLRAHSVAINDSTTIHCWVSSSLLPDKEDAAASSSSRSNREGTKPLLLLIHGFGPRSTWQWRHQVPALAARFDLIVPDLLFFGNSTTRAPGRSEAFQAETLAGLLDALLPPPAGRRDKVAVMGWSYGGFVAYHLARMLGEERVGRVVIACSDLLKGEDDDQKFAKRAGVGSPAEVMMPRTTDDLRKLMTLGVYRPPGFMPGFLLRDALKNLFQENVEEKLQLLQGITLGNKNEFQLTPIPQDVLIVWGEYDQIFPLEKAIKMKECLGEKVKIEIVKNAGHLAQTEDPDHFNKLVLDFLLEAPTS